MVRGVQAEGWINVLSRGGLNTPHDHPNWTWSGCYYVSVPEGDKELSGNIEFFDTRTNVRTLTVEGAACFASKFKIKPKEVLINVDPFLICQDDKSNEWTSLFEYHQKFFKNYIIIIRCIIE